MILRVKYNYPWKTRKRMKIFYSFMFYGCRLGLSVRTSGCLSLSPRLTFGLSIAHHFNCLYISQVKWKKWMKPSVEKWAWGIRTNVNPNGSDNRQNMKHMNTYVCVYTWRVMVARGTHYPEPTYPWLYMRWIYHKYYVAFMACDTSGWMIMFKAVKCIGDVNNEMCKTAITSSPVGAQQE